MINPLKEHFPGITDNTHIVYVPITKTAYGDVQIVYLDRGLRGPLPGIDQAEIIEEVELQLYQIYAGYSPATDTLIIGRETDGTK